jgi:hypothetical protein
MRKLAFKRIHESCYSLSWDNSLIYLGKGLFIAKDEKTKKMNRLLAKLDMRRYDLHARPGDAQEKVLRLKPQIP